MKKMFAAIALLLLGPLSAGADELTVIAALGTPVPEHADREANWAGHVDYVQWSGDNIICGGRSGFVRCYDPKTKQQLWSARPDGELDSLSVAGNHMFILTRSRELLGGCVIQELRASDGKQIRTLSTNQLARLAGISRFSPCRIAWLPVSD